MNSYIARQPIFDGNVKIFAYELLFRNNDAESAYAGINADQASSRVVMESFHTIGLETMTAGRPAFINFTETLLLQDIATLFPKELLVVELLETIEPTPEIVEVCRGLKEKGYTLALDDFEYRPELEPLIDLVQIIKFDFLLSTPQEIADMLTHMDVRGKRLLAEKIESEELFKKAKAMGFDLFQGYFFSKPVTLSAKEITPLNIHYASLLKEVNKGADMDFAKMSETIRGDVALSYKLLRLVNSAFFGLRNEVTDIKRALAVLGARELRKWIFMMALMGLNTNKPDELIRMSMIRGRFMEQASQCSKLDFKTENSFLTGLFSMIDALTDQPMDAALDKMVLATEVRDALVNKTGPLYVLLLLTMSLEQGAWEQTDRCAGALGVDVQQVGQLYLDAVAWCGSLNFA